LRDAVASAVTPLARIILSKEFSLAAVLAACPDDGGVVRTLRR